MKENGSIIDTAIKIGFAVFGFLAFAFVFFIIFAL